jgi:FkbM family methyltransferase
MNLEKSTRINKIAKKFAGPLSRIICSQAIFKPARALDAYFNFLMGKGAGTGWSINHEISAALSLIGSRNPVVFDIGANIGSWSKLLSYQLPDSRVFMFEPSPDCQIEIRKLALPNATLIPMAAGEASGHAILHSSSETDGSASLHNRGDSYFQDRNYHDTQVNVTTIDDVMEQLSLNFVDFIKMDIEGHELFALRGAKKALEENRIGALSFEFGSGNINSRTYFRDFWSLLTDAGFQISRVTPSGRLVKIESYYEDMEYFRGVSNYIAEFTKVTQE